ncbi:MAG: sorbitol-6-phosphate dehydrogenase [Clostridia bacterium]|nr:sorbitol-6-phosphate dehydrogenase [Clostridia bacterium]
MKRLEGRVAIVTGSAQGIGRALAQRLGYEGCKLVVADINIDALNETVKDYADAVAVQVDVTNEEQVNAMVDTAVKKFGAVDILVANAGIVIAKPALEFPAGEWAKVVDVNLVGYFLCAKAAGKMMKRQGSGNIIQINSKSGKKGSYKNSAYIASKFGGIGLTQSLALEFAEFGIRVNAICPGNLLDSPLWTDSLTQQYGANRGMDDDEIRAYYDAKVPLGRTCSYEDVANVMTFLVSDEASYMTGQAINVAGGEEMN